MTLVLRRGAPSDAEACASICQIAFATISARHHFPPDFPSVEPARQLMDFMLSREDVFSVVAELEERRKAWKAPAPSKEDRRGYRKLFLESVTQADRGCDFDFLAAEEKIRIPRRA